jgi:hypothetical protein
VTRASFVEKLVRADAGYLLKKIGKWGKARMLPAFAQEREFCAMKSEAVNLPVIQLRLANYFGWWK